MWSIILRVGVVVGVALATYAWHQMNNAEGHSLIDSPYDRTRSRRRNYCVICKTAVEADKAKNVCRMDCIMHRDCIEQLISDGQDRCPGCYKSFEPSSRFYGRHEYQ